MDLKGSIHDHRTGFQHLRYPSVVDILRGHKGDAAVAVLGVVVPAEERAAKGPGVLQGAEALRKLRAILQGFELGRERFVVVDMGAAMSLGDAKISEQQRHCPGFHTRIPVGMQGELPERDVLPGAGLADQCLGQRSRLPRGYHPTNDIAAEHVEDDVEIEVAPLHRPLQFRDIPGPELVGAGGQQFRFGILGGWRRSARRSFSSPCVSSQARLEKAGS